LPASPLAGGHRRIDRVLDPAFVMNLEDLTMAELRARRADADQEEVDLSYVRRMLQGRVDIAGAELARRRGKGEGDLVERLSAVLSQDHREPAQGLGRHRSVEPSRVGETRRSEEAMVAETSLDDPSTLSEAELLDVIDRLREEEASVSVQRRTVQDVLDVLSGEMTRRYRDGRASVAALLER